MKEKNKNGKKQEEKEDTGRNAISSDLKPCSAIQAISSHLKKNNLSHF